MTKIIMHIDVNNAFLSWSAVLFLLQGYKKDIRNIDAVIGGDEKTRNGIVLAKSISAKHKGIITSETLYSARKKCHNLKIYPPNYQWYKKMSNQMFQLILKYTPDIEIMSIDECFLDFTPIKNKYSDELFFAKKIQKEIYQTLGFTVNIGIGNNKLCAKMASDFSKPNKIHTLYQKEISSKMWPLSIDKLFGVGIASGEKLKKLNIHTIYALAHSNESYLKRYFKNQAQYLIDSANGVGDDNIKSKIEPVKGIGNSKTLFKDFTNIQELYPILLQICENVAIELRKQNRYTNVVVVILKNNMFKTFSHQKKLNNSLNTTSDIFNITKELLKEMWNDTPIRLIGVRLERLTTIKHYQISLFEKENQNLKNEKLETIVDDLKIKYGITAITKASLINKKINKKY